MLEKKLANQQAIRYWSNRGIVKLAQRSLKIYKILQNQVKKRKLAKISKH